MLPRDLQASQFSGYPPQARGVAVANLSTLRQLPLSFLPSMLRELTEYDYKFPAERAAIDREFDYLRSLSAAQLADTFQAFSKIALSADLQQIDWVNRPGQFVEQQSAYLWTTHGLDAFREAATRYGNQLRSARTVAPLPARRLGIVVAGQGVATYDNPLFLNLLPHGTLFTKVEPNNGLEYLLAAVEARSHAHPSPYSHWYIDGGQGLRATPSLTAISYQALEPMRDRLLNFMQAEIARAGHGARGAALQPRPARSRQPGYGSSRRPGARPLSTKAVYRRLGDADLQHHVCPVDDA